MGRIVFDFSAGWLLTVPLLFLLLFFARSERRRGLNGRRTALLVGIRAVAFLFLVFLASRPLLTSREPPPRSSRSVALLFDSSESMSLQDHDKTRYQQALDFASQRLLPALN